MTFTIVRVKDVFEIFATSLVLVPMRVFFFSYFFSFFCKASSKIYCLKRIENIIAVNI